MKKIILFLLIVLHLNANVIESPVLSIDEEKNEATISVGILDVGMSGFIVHNIAQDHNSILKNIVVTAYDKEKRIATLKMSDYDGLRNNALPSGKWKIEVGDKAILAFGYTRAALIAPTEEIYHRISQSVKIQWLHPDIFATILSFRGHPTPLKSDFYAMSSSATVGLVFLYLEQKVYTVDAKSFIILSISDAPLVQESAVLPFYSRVENIEENWWGDGSSPLESYEPHYYELLVEANPTNKNLYETLKREDKKYEYLLKDFDIKD